MSTPEQADHTHNVSSPKMYLIVFAVLIFLTILTAAASRMHLGRWEFVVALSIAGLKAALVTLFFMHLIHMARVNWIIVFTGMFWLTIAFTLTMADYLTRTWYSIEANPQTALQTLADVEAPPPPPAEPAGR